MSHYNNQKSSISIYTKYVEFVLYTNNILNKYPKKETFTLVSEIKNIMYKGLENLIYALKSYNSKEKLSYLRSFDVQLTLMKIQVRISYKLKYISMQNYQTWSEKITDLSNMLGGWINYAKKNK